jgi:hypothetical protein
VRIPIDDRWLMPVYVVSVGTVLAMRMVMLRRHPSNIMVMDVRVISFPMAMENRAHDS